MLDKLNAIKARFDSLGVALSNPAIVNDNKKFAETSREYRSLEKIVNVRNEYVKVLDDIEFNKEVLNSPLLKDGVIMGGVIHGADEELREMAKQELPALDAKKAGLEATLRNMLIPKDPYDEKNAILEIRAGTGGDEASLFAGW